MKLILALTVTLWMPLCMATAEKPNVVVFLVDDMGWGDLACYGNEIIKSPKEWRTI